jgi:hypothetical protein
MQLRKGDGIVMATVNFPDKNHMFEVRLFEDVYTIDVNVLSRIDSTVRHLQSLAFSLRHQLISTRWFRE